MNFFSVLRAAALIALPVGAAGSIGFMLYAGRHNSSRILPVLFALWVISPFVAVGLAGGVSKGWSILTRSTLDCVTLIIALGSPAVYGCIAFKPPRAQAAFVFVVVPPASWLLIAIVAGLAYYQVRSRER
jgi:hypothetical protein